MQPPPLSHAGEFVLLEGERTVTVTREEHHQDVLAGRSGSTIAELRSCTITAGKHAGQDGLEVLLDGRRVGELTRLMAQRYRPMVDEIRARGNRAGCEAVLRDDTRGVQVELRLPAATERSTTEPPTAPLTIPVRGGASRWPGRPVAGGSHPVPRQRRRSPGSTQALPGTPAPYGVPTPPTTSRRRSRRLLGVTGAVVGVLVLASALGNGSRDEVPAGNSSALPSAAAAPAVPAAVEPSPETPVVVPAEPAARSTPQARPPAPATSKSATSKSATSTPATPKPATTKPTAPKPVPRTVQAAPAPKPEAEPKSSGCDPNYDGCVPIARDVDCEGGSGDGPAYVKGPVRVIGSDVYGLDRGGEPGIGCE